MVRDTSRVALKSALKTALKTALMLIALTSASWAAAGCESPERATEAPRPRTADPPAAAPTAPPSTVPAAPYPDRDPVLAQTLVEQHGALLLDVRTSVEFKGGHLPNAKNISHDQLGARLEEVARWVDGDKSTPVVVYCRSGRRSGIARGVLEKAGYTHVTNVGGMRDYPQAAGNGSSAPGSASR